MPRPHQPAVRSPTLERAAREKRRTAPGPFLLLFSHYYKRLLVPFLPRMPHTGEKRAHPRPTVSGSGRHVLNGEAFMKICTNCRCIALVTWRCKCPLYFLSRKLTQGPPEAHGWPHKHHRDGAKNARTRGAKWKCLGGSMNYSSNRESDKCCKL